MDWETSLFFMLFFRPVQKSAIFSKTVRGLTVPKSTEMFQNRKNFGTSEIDCESKGEAGFFTFFVPVCSKIEKILEQTSALQRQANRSFKSAFVPKFGGGYDFLFYFL